MLRSSFALFDPADTIAFLVGGRASRNDYPGERLVRLFELQSWIVGSDPEFSANAARLVGFCLLEQLEEQMKEKTGSVYLPGARTLFEDQRYRRIYKHVIGRHGGLSKLMNSPTRAALQKEYRGLQNGIATTCDLIDYRFRFLTHHVKPKSSANIAHSQFFLLNAPKKPMSWGTLSKRWSAHRRNSIFLYVMFRHLPDIQPYAFSEPDFLETLQSQSDDIAMLMTFFGMVKHVAGILGEGQLGNEDVIPRSLKAVRPSTSPISNEQLKRMNDYKDKWEAMRS